MTAGDQMDVFVIFAGPQNENKILSALVGLSVWVLATSLAAELAGRLVGRFS